ncbi:MAG TPA: NAD(P)/FAD-dependent oxidoreductase [Solirubrobacteraceae bacterium]|jgi:prolycopene isomerase|nr:NAD(P)/FAD-dependent oxidoreductase [Solirubrobacteraceae bacterium]
MAAPAGDSFDVVVIGAGLGGLSAGACLAKAGRKVLLVEREQGPGGNARAFRRGPYTFDPAIHVTAQGFNIEFLDFYLSALGIAGEVELLRAEDFFGVDIDGQRWRLPVGLDALKSYLAEQFPHEADGVTGFIETCAQTTRESQAPPPRVGLSDLDAVKAALPMLFKYRRSTLADVLDEYIKDPLAQAVCGASWPYLGLPPGRTSFMAYAGALMALLDPGPLYVRGSFQSLADALARCIEDNGGEIATVTSASAIELADGRVAGVELDGGKHVAAPVVVSNADARQTFERLLPAEALPERFMRRLGKMRPSISAFVLFSAARLDPAEHGLSHEHFVYPSADHDADYERVLEGRPGGTWFSLPSLHDSSLAPAGEHVIVLSSLMPYDIGEPWEQAKPRYMELMLDAAERVLPGYRDALTFADCATPATFERYTLAQQGAAYGWENTPDQTVPKRLDFRTPIEGLFLAGHWTHPGTGSIRCLLSGAQTAAAIEGREHPVELLGSLAGA